MQKTQYLLVCFLIASLLASCQNQATEQNTAIQTETPAPAAEQAANEPIEPNGAETVFALTEDERSIYENYVKSLDKETFRDVDPVSIAKIFIQCGIDGQWEAEYGMYAADGLTFTKEEYHAAHAEDLQAADISSRKDVADLVFFSLEDGVLVEDGGNRGHIDFQSSDGTAYSFRLAKSDKGIWEVKHNPFDEWE